MKCLLTSDLHLRGDRWKRLDALDEIIELGKKKGIDYLFIAGDLFDKEVDVEDLKVNLREEKFSDLPYEVIAIPGNHDEMAYREEEDFGKKFTLLNETPSTQKDLGDVNLVAVPYFEGDFEEIIDDLLKQKKEEKPNVLLLHCTFSGLMPGGYGKEAEYLPVTEEQLLQANFDYVFAGHVHSSTTRKPVGSKCTFLYPGSPVSITRNETGKRGVWLIDTEEKEVTPIYLDTFFYEEKELDLCPGESEGKLRELEEWVQGKDFENAELLINVEGFIEIDEDEFSQNLEEIKGKTNALQVNVKNEVKSAKSITETELYQRFKQKLEDEVEDDDDRRAIEKRGLEAFSRNARE